MGDFRCTKMACQPGLIYFGCHWVPDIIFCLGLCQSPVPFCYAISPVYYLRSESSKEPASHPMLLSKKQVKKEEERLTTELQLMTRERNDLKDQLKILTEGTVDNRYPLFQTSWGCRQCQPHLLPLNSRFVGGWAKLHVLNSSQGTGRP